MTIQLIPFLVCLAGLLWYALGARASDARPLALILFAVGLAVLLLGLDGRWAAHIG